MTESTPIYFTPMYLPIETGRMAEWYNKDMVGVCIDAYANEPANMRRADDEEVHAYFAAISYEENGGSTDGGTIISGPYPSAEDAYEATLSWAAGFENADIVWSDSK